MSAYNIILSDGTQSILIPPRQVSENLATIPLVGRELSGYGNVIATAQLRMLENFASATPPGDQFVGQGDPLVGQIWYDKNDEQIKVYDSSEQWVPVAEPAPEELNDLTDVNLTSPAQGEFLRYISGEWINSSFSLDFTQLTDTPSNRVRNSFLRVNDSGTALQWVSRVPTSDIEGAFPLSLLPLQEICDWLKENCVPPPAPLPTDPPPPTGEASVSGTHIGQSCTVQIPGSCGAPGILTATISDPQFTTPPYTYTWERVSGSQLDGGATIQISNTNNTTASVGTTMTRAASIVGNNNFSSRYSVRVTDNSSPPKTLFADIPTTTYTIVGSAAPPPATFSVRVGTSSFPLGQGISVAPGYEGFTGAGVFREAGQTIEIGFQITNPNFDFDTFTSSVGLSESITTGAGNTRIVTFTMPAQAVEIGFTSQQLIYQLEVNVSPPGEFSISPALYSPVGSNPTKVTSVAAGTSLSLVTSQIGSAILDSITSDCGGSLSPPANQPGPWTYTFTMPSNNCSLNVSGSLPPSPDGNVNAGGFFANSALFGVPDATSVEAFIVISPDGNVYRFQENCTLSGGFGSFPVCTTTTAQPIGKWIVNNFPSGVSAGDYTVSSITASGISGISYNPSSATIPSSGGSLASSLTFAYTNNSQNSEGVEVVVAIDAPSPLQSGSITLQLTAELA